MPRIAFLVSAFALFASSCSAQKFKYTADFTTSGIRTPSYFQTFEDRPDDCPPCFNCNLEDFQCHQFANCSASNGRCICPPGWGGDDCSEPLCGSLAMGNQRPPRKGPTCDCEPGWEGINCNVCQNNHACHSLMPEGEGGVCYKGGLVVHENYQQCDVTNKQILDQLKGQKPQVTFSCNNHTAECNFQCRIPLFVSSDLSLTSSSLGRPERILLLRP